MGNLIEELKKFHDSPEGKEFTKKYFAQLKREEDRVKQTHNIISSLSKKQREFKFKKLIKKHNKKYEDKLHKKGIMPHANNVLSLIFDAAYEYGKTIKTPLSGLEKHFPSEQYKYYDYYFTLTFGQGSVQSIFDKNKKLIFRM